MYNRLLSLPKKKSFFLFGQRGTGKTTLLNKEFGASALEISLLDSKTALTLSRAPWKLREMVLGKKAEQEIVIIDEIQKVPVLLDEVHRLIESEKVVFALTGSSARKLRRAGVNMLAGRAYAYTLYPLTFQELGGDFILDQALQWGTLPRVVNENSDQERSEFLYSYLSTYLREEIILEQIVRQIEPFGRFLEVAAQSNGEQLNFSNLARDTGLSDVTIKSYFTILEDTLIGYFLPTYHHSIRKRQKQAPKFYFNDLGLVRTIRNQVELAPVPQSFEYGNLFETFVINEIVRLNEYQRSRIRLSFLRIDDHDEIDLILERPDGTHVLIEVKSRETVGEREVATLNRLITSFKNTTTGYCLSRDRERKKIGQVLCVPWNEGICEIFK